LFRNSNSAGQRLIFLPENILMKLYYAILLSIVSSLSCANAAQVTNTHTYHYELLSNAENVGEINVKVIEQADGSYVITESTLFNITSMWGDINMRSTQIEAFSPVGKLLKADVKTLNGKKAYWRKAELSDNELWASYTQVQNVTEKEEEELAGTALALASNMIPGLGNALGVAQLFLSDDDAQPENLRFLASTYDTSFSNLPFYWSSKQHNLPAHLNLFDSEKLAITAFHIEDLGQKIVQLSSGGGAVETSHYKLQAPKGQPMEVWLAVSDHNSPYFYQVVGVDDDGPFHIVFKQHKGE
jgi:hypothetical protein